MLPEVFVKAVSVAHNFGHNLDGLVTVNVDKQVAVPQHASTCWTGRRRKASS